MGSVVKSNRMVRLDNRHSHRGLFAYMVQFRLRNGFTEYHDAIKFCYDNWGMSVDAEIYSRSYYEAKRNQTEFAFSPEWSYMERYGEHRIYLSDAAASWIRLSGLWGV